MKKQKVFYFKIAFVIVLSILITSYVSDQVFIANTPRIKPDAGKIFLAKILNFTGKSTSFIARLFIKNEKKRSPFYKEVAKGVYAKEDGIVQEKIYTVNDVKWVEYTFEHNGKTYTIRYAEGDSLPSKETLEKLVQ